jgi:hypothetical protein
MTTDKLASATRNEGALPIQVLNAGVVLLQVYLPLYFERCALTRDGQFVDAAASHRAARLVHLLASGQWAQDEAVLPLAKILCGLAPSTPLMAMDDAPTEKERDLCDSLLMAVMQHWDKLHGSSINGLRGNFLMRDGRLTHQGAGWQLDVEKRAYDVLLKTFPLPFESIKHRWMPEPLHVQWRW